LGEGFELFWGHVGDGSGFEGFEGHFVEAVFFVAGVEDVVEEEEVFDPDVLDVRFEVGVIGDFIEADFADEFVGGFFVLVYDAAFGVGGGEGKVVGVDGNGGRGREAFGVGGCGKDRSKEEEGDWMLNVEHGILNDEVKGREGRRLELKIRVWVLGG
jgi:hypothetical protein